MREIRTAIIIAVLRRTCPDWTERFEDWADTYRKIAKTCDRLHQEIFGIAFDPGRSPLFALLAFAWCVYPLWMFRYVFYRGNNCISESLQDFIMEHHLYRTEAGCGVPDTHTGARRVVDSIRLGYTWRDRVLIVRAFHDNTWREAANELDALGLPAALQRPLGSKVMGANHTDYRFYDCLEPSE